MIGNSYLNTKETANALGVSTDYLRKLQRLGLPYHQLSEHSQKYFNLDEIENWLAQAGLHTHQN
ncbi:helix-turn-helix domain-containing protein [Limosilactobacillus caecicola]|uniref:helix-turn-helix domain-containing protein n=1 Tax=Limosilactobacillus caecicola TaxID=2941332 RepID=UPI0020413287|nr:helix-turn-helix domain-containing protein [Limosilactobacillus caecicola]